MCNENFKVLKIGIEEDTGRWRDPPCSWTRRHWETSRHWEIERSTMLMDQ